VGSDSDYEAFAADDVPSTIGSTRQHAGSVLPKPPQTTLGDRPSGVDSQTRPVRPTSPRPPLTDVPALRQAALGLGTRLPFCAPLRVPPRKCTAPGPKTRSSHRPPMAPEGDREPFRPHSRPPLWGRLGLLGWTSLRRRTSWDQDGSFGRGHPRLSGDAKPPVRPCGSPRMTGNSHDLAGPVSLIARKSPRAGVRKADRHPSGLRRRSGTTGGT
jgi:hypothetical protein